MKSFRVFGLVLVALALIAQPMLAQAATASVVLSWAQSTTPGVLYNVYRETAAGACTSTTSGTGPACLKLNTTPLAVLTYTDAPAMGSQYFYVVRSTINGVESANSNEVSVNLATPNPPTSLKCTITITGSIASGTCQ